jgi:hypothetical protein
LGIDGYLRALFGNFFPIPITSIVLSEISELWMLVSGHKCRDRRRHPFMLPELMSPTCEFSWNHEPGRYIFGPMDIVPLSHSHPLPSSTETFYFLFAYTCMLWDYITRPGFFRFSIQFSTISALVVRLRP